MTFLILKNIEESKLLFCTNKNIGSLNRAASFIHDYAILFLSTVFAGQLYLKQQYINNNDYFKVKLLLVLDLLNNFLYSII